MKTPDPLTPADIRSAILRLQALETRCWATHAHQMERYGSALQALPQRDPSVPYDRFTDPNYRAIERLDQLHLDRANTAYLRAKRLRKVRQALEVRLSVVEARAAVKAWADPFGVAA